MQEKLLGEKVALESTLDTKIPALQDVSETRIYRLNVLTHLLCKMTDRFREVSVASVGRESSLIHSNKRSLCVVYLLCRWRRNGRN